jgi:hypothetical protein
VSLYGRSSILRSSLVRGENAGVDARTTAGLETGATNQNRSEGLETGATNQNRSEGPETSATKQNRRETERPIGLNCAINGALRPWFGCVVETAKTTACGLIASELPW